MHSRSGSTSAATGTALQNNMSPTPRPELIRRHSTNTSSPDNYGLVKQEPTPMNSQPTTPATQSSFSNMQASSAQEMKAPHSLSQDIYPGAERFFNRQIFTNQLPQNVQMMGFSATDRDFQNAGMSFGYNVPANSSNEAPKSMQQSYTGSRALDQTLPYMPQSQVEPVNFSGQSSFQDQQQSDVQEHIPEQLNLNPEDWEAKLFTDVSYENYAGEFLDFPSGSQEDQNTAPSVNDGL